MTRMATGSTAPTASKIQCVMVRRGEAYAMYRPITVEAIRPIATAQ